MGIMQKQERKTFSGHKYLSRLALLISVFMLCGFLVSASPGKSGGQDPDLNVLADNPEANFNYAEGADEPPNDASCCTPSQQSKEEASTDDPAAAPDAIAQDGKSLQSEESP